jgi:hypothetical protein
MHASIANDFIGYSLYTTRKIGLCYKAAAAPVDPGWSQGYDV